MHRILAAALATTSIICAQQLPPLSQITEQYIKAIGGRDALNKMGPIAMRGECESSAPDEGGPVEVLIKTPKVVLNLNDDLRMGFDGESVWRATASEPLQQRKGRQFAELVTVFDPARGLSWKEWYPQMEVTGLRMIGDRDTYVLETAPGGPATERIFIDRDTGLPVRHELPGKYAFVFSDYREVNGLRMPFTVEETTPNEIKYTYRFKTITPAAEVQDSKFQPRQ